MSTKQHIAHVNAGVRQPHEHARAGLHEPSFIPTQHCSLNVDQIGQTLLGVAKAVALLPQPVTALSIK